MGSRRSPGRGPFPGSPRTPDKQRTRSEREGASARYGRTRKYGGKKKHIVRLSLSTVRQRYYITHRKLLCPLYCLFATRCPQRGTRRHRGGTSASWRLRLNGPHDSGTHVFRPQESRAFLCVKNTDASTRGDGWAPEPPRAGWRRASASAAKSAQQRTQLAERLRRHQDHPLRGASQDTKAL